MKDGGPAFPHSMEAANIGSPSVGMSLRDYFAAAAMQGILAGVESEYHTQLSGTSYAFIAYTVADAMLAERKKS
jgi:hypothetical protein